MQAVQPTLVYVAGYGRSGSTLLDVLLGNHRDVFGAGEFHWLFRVARDRGSCACRSPLPDCPFWRSVLGQVFRACPTLDSSKAAALTTQAERLWNGKADHDAHARLWQATLQAIVDVSGKRVIVDSSKTNRHAHSRLPLFTKRMDIPIKVVHVLRDPRAVMWSLCRRRNVCPEENGTIRTVSVSMRGLSGWVAANLVVERFLGRNPNLEVLRVRYEDLVRDSERTLQRLGNLVDLDLGSVLERIRKRESFDAGHGVAGNRMRRRGAIVLRFDEEWRTRLPRFAQMASTIAWPLMKKYGYACNGSGQDDLPRSRP